MKLINLIIFTFLALLSFSSPADTSLLSIHGAYPSYEPKPDRQPLLVGVVLDEYIPLYILKDNKKLEGVMADYLLGIMNWMKQPIQVKTFDSKAKAINALQLGKIDFLAGNYSDLRPGLIESRSYFPNRFVEVQRVKEDAPQRLRIAIGPHSSLGKKVKALYPESSIQIYNNGLQALLATSFKQADLFIGNPTEANYLINLLALDNLEIKNYSPVEDDAFVFIFKSSNAQLLQAINQSLQSISQKDDYIIQKRWQGGIEHFNISKKMQLSKTEAEWLKKHPVAKFSVPADLYPLAFKESMHAPSIGLSIDVLHKISELTGLRFVEVRQSGASNWLDRSIEDFDIIPVLAVTEQRRQSFLLSAPYIQSLWGISTLKENHQIRSLNDLANKKVAIIKSSIAKETIEDEALKNKIQFVEVPDLLTTFQLLAQGKVDANINGFLAARTVINSGELGDFKIVGTSNQTAVDVAIATNKNATMLAEIINKAILSIPQEELNQLRSEWSNTKVGTVRGGLTHLNIEKYKQLAIATAALLIFILMLAIYRMYKHWLREKKLKKQLNFLDDIINQLPYAVFIQFPSHGIEVTNNSYRDLHQVTVDDTLKDAQINVINLAKENESTTFIESKISLTNETKELLLWAQPFFTTPQRKGAIMGGWFDITKQKKGERELKKAKTDAERANRAKTSFLAIISHEIRTPMNAILGLLELEIKKSTNKNLATAFESAKKLLHLLDGLLDQAKIEAGQLKINAHPTNFTKTLKSLVSTYKPIANENGIQLQLKIQNDLPDFLYLDENKLNQILNNLVSNSIKFTQGGKVNVKCTWRQNDKKNGVLTLYVTDNGEGISKASQKTIFDAYMQDRPSKKGTGLGLWICKNIINEMGGKIRLKSKPGMGTSICLTIPTHECDEDVSSFTPFSSPLIPPFLRIFIVDDQAPNRLLLEQQLRFMGITNTQSFSSAVDVLNVLETENCDVLICDCFMPEMDGFDLAKQIHRKFSSPPCIVGCTADARTSNLDRALSSGMNICLVKPISFQQLAEALSDGLELSEIELSRRKSIYKKIHEMSFSVKEVSDFIFLLNKCIVEDISVLQQAVKNKDSNEVASLSHKLMGSSRMIGDEETLALCELLRESAEENDFQACDKLARDLKISMEKLILITEQFIKNQA